MPRLNREESQARTRDLLIEAARNEIVKKGFALASVRDIADAAGFSQGAFYSNFRTRRRSCWSSCGGTNPKSAPRSRPRWARLRATSPTRWREIEKWASTINSDPGFAVLATELQLQALRSPSFAQGYNDLNRKHRRALGTLVSRMFELFGKKVPGDPVEIATAFIALGRGMALMSKEGETSRSGRIVVTFLKALIGSAPSAT